MVNLSCKILEFWANMSSYGVFFFNPVDNDTARYYICFMERFVNQKSIFVKTFVYNHDDGDFADMHKHACWELCYYESGEGKTIIEQNVFNHKQNDIVLIEPNHLHNDICLKNQTVYVLQFDYSINGSSKLIEYKPEIADYVEKIAEQLKILQNVKADVSTPKELLADKSNEATRYIALLVTKIIQTKKTQYYYEQIVSYVKSYLYNHNRINYVALEEKTGYSTDRLRKIFKKHAKMPIYKYHSELILTKIKTLLTKTNYSMKTIAKTCGFSSQSMFSQFFYNCCEITPLKYRKLYTAKPTDGVFKAGDRNKTKPVPPRKRTARTNEKNL